MECQYYITKSKRNCKNKALNNDLNYCTRHFNKFTSNETENSKSEKNETENSKSEKNESENNKSENDKSENNKSENDKSEKNESENNKSENDKSEKNESDKNESENVESENIESENDKSENDKSENIKIKKTKKKLDENINKCIYTLKTNRVCNKKANILYKGIYYCDKHYNSIMVLKKKEIINEINIIKKTKINNNNQSTIKKKIYKILLEIHPDKCIIPNINPTELTQNLTDILNKLKI